jgi:hypothetical protein
VSHGSKTARTLPGRAVSARSTRHEVGADAFNDDLASIF